MAAKIATSISEFQETFSCLNEACYGCRLYSRHVLLHRWQEDNYPDSHLLITHFFCYRTTIASRVQNYLHPTSLSYHLLGVMRPWLSQIRNQCLPY